MFDSLKLDCEKHGVHSIVSCGKCLQDLSKQVHELHGMLEDVTTNSINIKEINEYLNSIELRPIPTL